MLTSARVQALSDGVIAIVITIMVLEMKIPHHTEWAALNPVMPIFASYVMSFLFLGIYWSNHHHMMHHCKHVNGRIVWANFNFLFWCSLIPFVTGWLGENELTTSTVMLYGVVLLMTTIGYTILQRQVLKLEAEDSKLRIAIGRDYKGKASIVLYSVAVPLALRDSYVSMTIYIVVALLWLAPDRTFDIRLDRQQIEEVADE
jgi:uncharacterized membrane protein